MLVLQLLSVEMIKATFAAAKPLNGIFALSNFAFCGGGISAQV
jgi:hypothetical protein